MTGAWVYIRSRHEPLWTVGFYKPDGSWEPESDHANAEEAAKRVSYLNGGGRPGTKVEAWAVLMENGEIDHLEYDSSHESREDARRFLDELCHRWTKEQGRDHKVVRVEITVVPE